jgi:hypothetical protein
MFHRARERIPQKSIHRIAVNRQLKDCSFMVAVLVVVVVSAMLVFCDLISLEGILLAIVSVRE